MQINRMNNEFQIISFWSWNGEMNESEIRWQIKEFAKQGFGGFFIHSRAGLYLEYMKEDWLDACAVAIGEAEEQHIDVWLYDEDGWPSGFAGGKVPGLGEDYQAKKMMFSFGKPNDANSRIISVYRKSESGEYSRIAENMANDADLYCYYVLNKSYVDLLNPQVTAKFIEFTHEVYAKRFGKYFGNIIKGIFTDEPQIPCDGPPWSVALSAAFESKYHENILDNLWLMFEDGENYRSFRYRFWSVVSDLFTSNFTKQINNWCYAHNILFTGHFSSEDGLCSQSTSSTGVMRNYYDMGIPGIDHLGRRLASPVLMKQVSSVAQQTNKPYVLSESYGCAGWDISFEDILGITGWQAVMGVNTICAHLSAYSIIGRRKRDYPAFYSYQEPWWDDFHYVSDYIRSLNCIISSSKRLTKVAIVNPIRSLWCETKNDLVFRNRTISGKFRNLIENITDVHVDFDIIDESMLETLTINKSKLVNDNVSYSMIIVPQMDSLSKEAANKIIDFADNNGHIMFVNERPIYIEGAKCELAESIRSIKAIEIQNNRGIWQKYFKSAPVQDSFSLLDERLNDEVSGVATYFGSLNSNYVAYLFNHKLGHSINAVIRKKGNYKISVYNPLNNTNQLLESSFYGKYTYANITINSYNGILLMIEENAENTVFVSKRLVEHNVLKTDGVSLSDYNALTLDYGQFSINNGEFSEKKAVIHMVDQIYRELSSIKTDSNVTIKFEFNIDFKTTIKRELNLVTEEVEGLDITVNGTTVTESKKWWIDKGFRVFDICDLVKNESNTIVLNYKIPKQNKLHDITNKFESERNRFYYAIEPENIYIYGDFDVDYKGVPLKMSTHYCLPCKPCENSFYITDSTSKQIGDLTTQGLWFYRGNAEYTSTFNYQTDNEVKLRLDNPSCTFAKPFVNNQIAGIILNKNDSVNITDLLKKGENQIKVEIYGHNRNLFGPHHHFKGQNFFVGPSTFIGTKGFEDFVSSDIVEKNTWTDNYSFVPFTCGSIVLEMYK